MNAEQEALSRYYHLLALAVRETPHIDLAILAAEEAYRLSPQPDAAFALEDAPEAREVISLALAAARRLAGRSRAELVAITHEADAATMAEALVRWAARRRAELAAALGAAQAAALLRGASEVAAALPPLAPWPVPPPATLSPARATSLLERLRRLPQRLRDLELGSLAYPERRFAAAALEAPPPPPMSSVVVTRDEDNAVYWPVIEAAADDLRGKNILDRTSWERLNDQVLSRAVGVATAEAQEALTGVRELLAQNITRGADLEAFRVALRSLPGAPALSDARVETLFRTAVMASVSDGQAHVLSHPLVRPGFPYAAYDPIDDDRVRHHHLELGRLGIDGTNVYRIDDPVFQLFRPPWAWNCRCNWRPMTLRQAAEAGVAEAREWLSTGVEPSPPAFVLMPDFRPDPSFRRFVAEAGPSVALSLSPLSEWGAEFAWVPHGTSGAGASRWKNTDTGEVRYQKTMPGSRRAAVQEATQPRQGAAGGQAGQARQVPEDPWQEYVGRMGQRKGQKGFRHAVTGRVVWGEQKPQPGSRRSQPKYTPEQAVTRVKELLAEPARIVPETIRTMAEELMTMTVAQLQDMKRRLGVRASGVKSELARKVLEKAFMTQTVAGAAGQAAAAKQAGAGALDISKATDDQLRQRNEELYKALSGGRKIKWDERARMTREYEEVGKERRRRDREREKKLEQQKGDEAVAWLRTVARPDGDTPEHGMTVPEMTSEFFHEGVVFRWAEGCERAAATSIRDLLDAREKGGIPERLWNATGGLVFTTQQNSKDSYWEQQYNSPGFRSHATGGDGRIVVYNGWSTSIDSFNHESGHNLATSLWGDTRPSPSSEYGIAQASEPPVTHYGAKSPAEDFADACKLYGDPETREDFKTNFPMKYAALSNLFGPQTTPAGTAGPSVSINPV